jgi:anaerobic selenocysteine-containing dehydrogenase
VLNGLLNLIIENGKTDTEFISKHTVGFEFLRDTVALWSPERVEKVSGVPADKLRAAADILGNANSLVSSVLQGVYQSNQATAAAVQVNNINLIRGLIGKPGSGVPTDEWSTHRTEHPRVRSRWRPSGLSQLGQSCAH